MQGWNEHYLRQLQKKIRSKINTTTNVDIIRRYDEALESIEEIIDYISVECLNDDFYQSDSNIKDVIRDDLNIVRSFGFYYPYIKLLRDKLSEIEWPTDDEGLKKLVTTNDEVLDTTRDFYKEVGGVYSKCFETLYSRKNRIINIIDLTKANQVSAYTYPVYNTDIVLFNLGYDNTIQDYLTTIHEFGHGISHLMNMNVMFDYNRYCFQEFDTLFWEFVGLDYIAEKIDEEDAKMLRDGILYDYYRTAQLICAKVDAFSYFPNIKSMSRKNYRKYLFKEYNFTDEFIEEVIDTRIAGNFHYVISYMSAIELYLIYKQDKEKALNILEKAISLKNYDSGSFLRLFKELGLEPGAHLDEFLEPYKRGVHLGKKIQN